MFVQHIALAYNRHSNKCQLPISFTSLTNISSLQLVFSCPYQDQHNPREVCLVCISLMIAPSHGDPSGSVATHLSFLCPLALETIWSYAQCLLTLQGGPLPVPLYWQPLHSQPLGPSRSAPGLLPSIHTSPLLVSRAHSAMPQSAGPDGHLPLWILRFYVGQVPAFFLLGLPHVASDFSLLQRVNAGPQDKQGWLTASPTRGVLARSSGRDRVQCPHLFLSL